MKMFKLLLLILVFNSCAIVPIKDFKNYRKFAKTKNDKIELNFKSIYPDKIIDSANNDGNGPSYKYDFQIPNQFMDCQIKIWHEVTHFSTNLSSGVMKNLSVYSLGIIPYSEELAFKTKMAIKSKNSSVEKEISSQKVKVFTGIFFIPSLMSALFSSDVYLTNKITSEMYSYQINILTEQLKDFSCE